MATTGTKRPFNHGLTQEKSMSLQTLLLAAKAKQQKIATAIVLATLSSIAAAQTAPAGPSLDSVLDTFMTSILLGISTTFGKVGPILALVYGVVFAWRWAKKASSQ
jgi:hypothetical protein